MKHDNDTKLQDSLKQIQLRAQVAYGRVLTHEDLAGLAGVSARSLGDWMRGATAPIGMSAVFALLACLSDDDKIEVINYWKKNGRPLPVIKKRKSTAPNRSKARSKVVSSPA